jgi:hypothetical protein
MLLQQTIILIKPLQSQLFKSYFNKNFNVKVKAGGANFEWNQLIPVNVLTIKAATAPELWEEQKVL